MNAKEEKTHRIEQACKEVIKIQKTISRKKRESEEKQIAKKFKTLKKSVKSTMLNIFLFVELLQAKEFNINRSAWETDRFFHYITFSYLGCWLAPSETEGFFYTPVKNNEKLYI